MSDRPVSTHGVPACAVQASGTIELYFYGELDAAERSAADLHLAACRECRESLVELALIREALAARPAVSAPPSGDWSGFMSRLDKALGREPASRGAGDVVPFRHEQPRKAGSYVPLLAMAALLALVSINVMFVVRSRGTMDWPVAVVTGVPAEPASAGDGDREALASISQQHLERSKLVLLGLANRDAAQTSGTDWTYERELASRLLTDTRLYRLAAEDQGLDALAGVMGDLELILLQTSMTESTDPGALSQIQRAIRKRDLLQKMDVVRTTAGT